MPSLMRPSWKAFAPAAFLLIAGMAQASCGAAGRPAAPRPETSAARAPLPQEPTGRPEKPAEPDAGEAVDPAQVTLDAGAGMGRQVGVICYLWFLRGRMHGAGSLRSTLGLYDSTDPEVQRAHIRLWKEAGVDFVAGSWWGLGESRFHQQIHQAAQGYLERCAEEGMRWCIYLEEVPGGLERNLEQVRKWTRSPAYYRWGERPVLFVYDRVYEQAPRSALLPYAKEFFLVLTSPPVERLPADVGFGCHWWKVPFIPEDFLRARYKAVLARKDLVLFPLVYHGFDNTAFAQEPKKWPQRGSSLEWFRRQLDQALEHRPPVLMFSWNELGEHTAFEPTEEFGTRYYDAMKEAIAAFKKAP